MDFSRIKNFAKTKLKEQFGMAFLLTLIATAAISVPTAIWDGFSLPVAFLLSPAINLSLIHIFVAILAGRKPEFKELLSGFDDWWSSVKVYFFQTLYTFLWSLLFIIPGIVKACAYSQAMYILSGNPGKSARECLRESEQLMQGQKMRFFKLNLSFIGWVLLCIVTLGIAFIWVVPYYRATMATFYIDIMPSTSDDTDTYDEPTPTRTNGRTITFGNKSGGSDISKG